MAAVVEFAFETECPECNGTGEMWFGDVIGIGACNRCVGSGKTWVPASALSPADRVRHREEISNELRELAREMTELVDRRDCLLRLDEEERIA